MIELSPSQRQAVHAPPGEPVRLVDPDTQQPFVLLPADLYERLKDGYDDSPWTDEEMDRLAEEAGELLDRYEP